VSCEFIKSCSLLNRFRSFRKYQGNKKVMDLLQKFAGAAGGGGFPGMGGGFPGGMGGMGGMGGFPNFGGMGGAAPESGDASAPPKSETKKDFHDDGLD